MPGLLRHSICTRQPCFTPISPIRKPSLEEDKKYVVRGHTVTEGARMSSATELMLCPPNHTLLPQPLLGWQVISSGALVGMCQVSGAGVRWRRVHSLRSLCSAPAVELDTARSIRR